MKTDLLKTIGELMDELSELRAGMVADVKDAEMRAIALYDRATDALDKAKEKSQASDPECETWIGKSDVAKEHGEAYAAECRAAMDRIDSLDKDVGEVAEKLKNILGILE